MTGDHVLEPLGLAHGAHKETSKTVVPASPRRVGCLTLATVLRAPRDSEDPLSLSTGYLPIVPAEDFPQNEHTQYRHPEVIEAISFAGTSSLMSFAARVAQMNRDKQSFHQVGAFSFQPLPESMYDEYDPKPIQALHKEDTERTLPERIFLGQSNIKWLKVHMVPRLLSGLKDLGVEVSDKMLYEIKRARDPFSILMQSYPFLAHYLFNGPVSLQVLYTTALLRFSEDLAPLPYSVVYIRYDPKRVHVQGVESPARWMFSRPVVL